MAKRIAFSLFMAMMTVSFAGCGIMFAPNRKVSRAVAESELIGVWNLTRESLGYLRRDGYQPSDGAKHSFELCADHSVKFTSVYNVTGFPFVDGSGAWEIKDGKRLELVIDAADRRFQLGFDIGEDRRGLFFFEFHGDPDMWEFEEYTMNGSR